MKKIQFVIASICVVAVSSCSERGLDKAPVNSEAQQEIEITASLCDSGDTKTVRKEDGKIYWNPADEIKVFSDCGSSKFTSKNNEDALTATFSGSITGLIGKNEGGEAGNCLWGLYPYRPDASCDGQSVTTTLSNLQTAVAGSFADDLFITLARDASFSLSFYNVLSGFRFTLTKEGITRMTFSGNNGEVLAGKLKMAFGENSRPVVQEVTDGKTTITLTPEADTFEAGKDYYFVFAPTDFEKGFTVTMDTAESEGIFVYDKSVSFARNNFIRKTGVDAGVEFVGKEPEYVDLGLSVKWAKCNVGAVNPEEFGDYYAWGETEPKSSYSLNLYKWFKEHIVMDAASHSFFNLYSKYYYYSDEYTLYLLQNMQSLNDYGPVDGSMALDPSDDVAHVMMGGKWRMPSKEEWDELVNPGNCIWEWTTLNDITGYKVTSRKEGYNGKWIFLPAASNAGNVFDIGFEGYYWSLSMTYHFNYMNDYESADCLYINRNSHYNIPFRRYSGLPVRPVYGDRVHVTGISLDRTSLPLFVGEEYQLEATLTPSDCANKGVVWNSSNPEVAFVSSTGVIRPLGRQTGTVVITATTVDGGYVASCDVTVYPTSYGMTDLGLSVKWGDVNLGSMYFPAPVYGFSWGTGYRINPAYDTDYNYSWNKYNSTDGKTVLDPSDDSATAYRAKWRTPTKKEWEELIDPENCKWEKTRMRSGSESYAGNKVISRKAGYTDRMIFIPDGIYWSASLDVTEEGNYSDAVSVYSSYYTGAQFTRTQRDQCLPVRPVSDK